MLNIIKQARHAERRVDFIGRNFSLLSESKYSLGRLQGGSGGEGRRSHVGQTGRLLPRRRQGVTIKPNGARSGLWGSSVGISKRAVPQNGLQVRNAWERLRMEGGWPVRRGRGPPPRDPISSKRVTLPLPPCKRVTLVRRCLQRGRGCSQTPVVQTLKRGSGKQLEPRQRAELTTRDHFYLTSPQMRGEKTFIRSHKGHL